MRALRLLPILLGVPIAGCASFADLTDEGHVRIVDLINVVRCELDKAVSDRPALEKWAAVISFDLTGISSGTASADATIVVPLSAGSFSFGFKTGRTETASNAGKFAIEEVNLSKVPCAQQSPQPATVLTGDIGLRSWVVHVVDTSMAVNRSIKEIYYDVSFVIKRNAEGTARFSLIPVGSANTSPGALIAGNASLSQKIIVVLKPQAASPEQTKKVLDDALQRFLERNTD